MPPASSMSGFLCLDFFRFVLGWMGWDGGTAPTRSRASRRTDLPRLYAFRFPAINRRFQPVLRAKRLKKLSEFHCGRWAALAILAASAATSRLNRAAAAVFTGCAASSDGAW